jgi:hypothetical protein
MAHLGTPYGTCRPSCSTSPPKVLSLAPSSCLISTKTSPFPSKTTSAGLQTGKSFLSPHLNLSHESNTFGENTTEVGGLFSPPPGESLALLGDWAIITFFFFEYYGRNKNRSWSMGRLERWRNGGDEVVTRRDK